MATQKSNSCSAGDRKPHSGAFPWSSRVPTASMMLLCSSTPSLTFCVSATTGTDRPPAHSVMDRHEKKNFKKEQIFVVGVAGPWKLAGRSMGSVGEKVRGPAILLNLARPNSRGSKTRGCGSRWS